MNHTEIEEQQTVDLYLMGKLPAEEAARFEEHYLSCPECLDRLEEAESLQRGFKRAAGQDVARQAATRQLALLAWLSRLGRSRQMAFLLLALFAVAALPGGLALRKIEDKDRELDETRLALKKTQEEKQAADLRAAQAAADSKELEAKLAREQEARAGRAKQQEREQAPESQAIDGFLTLDTERGGGPADESDLPAVYLSKSSQGIVFSLAIDPSGKPAYRVILRGPKGNELWRGEDLHEMEGDNHGTLSLVIPSRRLERRGIHTLTVEGLVPGGKPVPAGRFVFRVEPAR